MAKLTRTPLAETHLQNFAGGLRRLSGHVKALLRGSCCEGDLEVRKDRLPARMRFDNGLAHENPNGANQKWSFERDPYNVEAIQHLNDYKVDATIGVIAPPSYSFVTAFGISAGRLPEGFTFKLGSRFGTLDGVTGTLHTITLTGEDCEPVRDYVKAEGTDLSAVVVSALAAGELRKDYVFIPDTPVFFAQADEVLVDVETFATSGSVTTADFDLTVAVNYDLVIRSEI